MTLRVPSHPALPPTLRWWAAWVFPVATREGRRGVALGALALVTLLPGWVMNLGYRWEVATRLSHGETPVFTPFRWSRRTWTLGLTVWGVITLSLSPGAAAALIAWGAARMHWTGLATAAWTAALALLLGAFLLVPAGMTRLGCEGDRTVLTAPWRLWPVVRARLAAYVWAWCVTGSAVLVSLGVPALMAAGWGAPVGDWVRGGWPVTVTRWPTAPGEVLLAVVTLALFFVLSVWAWQVAGYAFTVALYGRGLNGIQRAPGA